MKALDRRQVKKIIAASREVMPDECKEIALSDIRRVLEEYFSITGEVALEIQPTKEGYFVRIDFTADRVRLFNVVR